MYIERLFAPVSGMDRRSFYDQNSWVNLKEFLRQAKQLPLRPFMEKQLKGCCLGVENCYYLISVSPKPKSECIWAESYLYRLVYQEDYEGSGGALICMSMNTIALTCRNAAKTASISNSDGSTASAILVLCSIHTAGRR